MEKNAKIYVAGHRGMVGSAIVRELKRQGYENIITRTHKELDLTRQDAVERFFAEKKPEYVFCSCQSGRHRGEPVRIGRLHVREHDTGDERDSCGLEKRLQETGIPRFVVYLSAHGPAADERELPADLGIGEDQRGVCSGEDFRTEILRIPEPAVRHGLHQRDAYQSLWTE